MCPSPTAAPCPGLLLAGQGWWHRVVAPGGGTGWWHGVVAHCGGTLWWHSAVHALVHGGSSEGVMPSMDPRLSLPLGFRKLWGLGTGTTLSIWGFSSDTKMKNCFSVLLKTL